eukprot:6172575-Pleurochrysis_carterae.AAC.1
MRDGPLIRCFKCDIDAQMRTSSERGIKLQILWHLELLAICKYARVTVVRMAYNLQVHRAFSSLRAKKQRSICAQATFLLRRLSSIHLSLKSLKHPSLNF